MNQITIWKRVFLASIALLPAQAAIAQVATAQVTPTVATQAEAAQTEASKTEAAPADTAKVEPPALTVPLPESCQTRTDVLGLSRVVEIDTAGGPRFGTLQYKGNDFLADGEVVLTFDDGPARRYTQPILDALDAQCTRATFFVVGRMSLHDPEMLKEVAKRGHTIGNHTWSHKNLAGASAASAKQEIELGLSISSMALGAPLSPFFRYPYLAHSKVSLAHLASRNISAFSIDVDPKDFKTHNPGTVVKTVMGILEKQRKGIILFHDIQPGTAAAMPSLLAELKNKGFKVVHVVAKTPAQTSPEFDAMAAKLFAKKQGPAVAGAAKGEADANGLVQPTSTQPVALPWEGDSVPQGATPDEAEVVTPPAKTRSRPVKARTPQSGEDPNWQLRGYVGD